MSTETAPVTSVTGELVTVWGRGLAQPPNDRHERRGTAPPCLGVQAAQMGRSVTLSLDPRVNGRHRFACLINYQTLRDTAVLRA